MKIIKLILAIVLATVIGKFIGLTMVEPIVKSRKPSFQEVMNTEFAKIKPRWIDEVTYHLPPVMTSDKKLTYFYLLQANGHEGVTDLHFLTDEFKNAQYEMISGHICSNPSTSKLLNKGIAITYHYTIKQTNDFITKFTFTPLHCEK